MQQYIARRLLQGLLVLIMVSIATFTLVRFIPGDVIDALVAEGQGLALTRKDAQALRHELGLDQPFHIQYFRWLGRVVRGDFGESLRTGESVRARIGRTLPVSVEVGLLALFVGAVIAIPIGVLSAIRQDTPLDYGGRLVAIGGLSMPDFWIGTMFLLYTSLWFHYSPPMGYGTLTGDPLRNLQQVIWPVLIMGFRLSGTSMRMTRSAMLEVFRQDYIRTAWSKGLRERVVVYRHALKNALIPVVTIVGSQVGVVIGGTVIMETLFNLPGMGRLTLDAIRQRDYAQLQGNVMVLCSAVVLVNILVDLSYAWLDPRIRYR